MSIKVNQVNNSLFDETLTSNVRLISSQYRNSKCIILKIAILKDLISEIKASYC